MRSLAITLDLDSPTEYAALHGVSIDNEDPLLMYRGPLERFASLCESIGAPGTLFVISRDLVGIAVDRLRDMLRRGYEIASHSHSHDYGLAQRDANAMLFEIRGSKLRIERHIGQAPLGFRAPGYVLSPALLDELVAQGFAYDSSVLPSPPYYLAKVAVLLGYRLTRRASVATLAPWQSLGAPRQPYRPGNDPYRPGARPIVELPVSVAGRLGMPVTGAALVLAPGLVRERLLAGLEGQETLVLNLHGMDLVDVATDALPRALVPFQPELRVSIDRRMQILRDCLATLAAGRTTATCAEIASQVD